ncbi:MAG TPA: MFS transporter [Candidatus Dormibacteraeota bacterium]|nr:MFS transporter [Candidatus Dormibacteraeota bacterium]
MYTQLRDSLAAASADRPEEQRVPWWRVSRNVVNLGLTSFFTDVSSEMISTVLPLYLVFALRMTTLQLGVVDGVYTGATALMRLAAGLAADRGGRHKEVALAGYGLSAVCKLGLLAAGGAFGPLVAVIMADRAGKGIRTAPRDALISLSTPPERLGIAFGVHRALDTGGALVGPLVAFALLTALPGKFDAIFMVSFCFAAIGVAVLLVLVEGRRAKAAAGPAFSLRPALALLRLPRFRLLVLAGAGLGLATIADAFVYLALQRRVEFPPTFLPLLYVLTSVVYLLLAVPAGRVADRLGRGRVLVGGYVALAAVYVALLLPADGPALVLGAVLAFGAYYACTDGVMSALASGLLPAESRSAGLALLGTGIALAGLVGSVLFGAIWTAAGLQAAVVAFLVGLALATGLLAAGLIRTRTAGR